MDEILAVPDLPIINESVKKKPKKNINWHKVLEKITYLGGFSLLAVLMVGASTISTPDNGILIIVILMSVLVNIIILLGVFGTGIGIELGKRFLNKFRYRSGRYVNTILIMKSGVTREFFKKKDNETNDFKIHDTRYITNPMLSFVYRGIPTYFHREGNPDPMNIWEDKYTGKLSNAEMDTVMNSKGMFDLKEWLEKNKTILIFTAFVIVGAAAASAGLAYMSFEMLRDGTLNVGPVVCSNLPQAPVIPGTQL